MRCRIIAKATKFYLQWDPTYFIPKLTAIGVLESCALVQYHLYCLLPDYFVFRITHYLPVIDELHYYRFRLVPNNKNHALAL